MTTPEPRKSPRQARPLEGRIGYAGKYRLQRLIHRGRLQQPARGKFANLRPSSRTWSLVRGSNGTSRRPYRHGSAITGVNDGQVVEYEEVANKDKTSAENLKVSR